MNRINFLPPWVETNLQPAFYDAESGSVLQQTARMYAKVNQLVRNVNEQNEAIELYIAKFIELKDYVEDYFENLDVQEEINNKLDQMVEDGTLQEIITQYIQANVAWAFNSVAEMKSATNLISGSYAETSGYYAIGDGGEAYYHVREITNEDVVDEASIIALANNTLVAELVVVNKVIVEQFGAKGDGTTDDTSAIQSAINYCSSHNFKLSFCKKTYMVSNLTIGSSSINKFIIEGNNATLKSNGSGYILTFTSNAMKVILKDMEVNGNFTASGILLQSSQRNSLKNIVFHYCLTGLEFISVWYGNVDNNCLFDSCLTAIKLSEDLSNPYYGENNTIEFNNFSIDAHHVPSSSYGIENGKSVGIEISSLVHEIKIDGITFENMDYAIKSGTTHLNGGDGIYGCLTITKCYFEDIDESWLDWAKTDSSHYLNSKFVIEDNHFYPYAALKAKLDCSSFTIVNNMNFLLETYVDNRNLKITTDLNDYYIDTTNYNYTTKVIKVDNFINRTTTLVYDNPATAQTYPSSKSLNLARQNDIYDASPFFKNNNNILIKNSKAYSINSKNVLFDDQGIVPVGVIINGTDGNKYMLSTDDGSSINLVKMRNFSRMYERVNSHDAYWLYANRNNLSDGYKAWCNDIEKNVKLVKSNGTAEWWTDETTSYLCIGTSASLYANMGVQPVAYWRPCWDLSFNRCVLWHGTRYNVGYDYFMNNNPQDTTTQILAYGNIADRPASPTYTAIYYAVDEQKYYKWDLSTWTEVTKIM